ncbi:helix-turn-helix domain-containing protein [Rothia halotolerans]|uniref:helix-turn-helix domain-containing protein n=1 Tax=Rothia halotolerans TaxID=405770 RepID=UPI001EDF46BE|nr:helix-turn-helix transcriptional regulator [Rothia halotolerans]
MADRSELLRQVMLSTGTTQSELSKISGIHQPSISQFLAGKVDFSDRRVDRLLACMGLRLEVVRRAVEPELTRAEHRSWLLHRTLSSRLTRTSLDQWQPVIEGNLTRLHEGVTGQPHERNVARWAALNGERDVLGLKRVMTGLDRDSMEMREVSPMSGLLSESERLDALVGAA